MFHLILKIKLKYYENENTTSTCEKQKFFCLLVLSPLKSSGLIVPVLTLVAHMCYKSLCFATKASSPRKLVSSSNQRLKQEREKVRYLLGEEERARELRRARDLFDPNGTGTIDVNRITASSFFFFFNHGCTYGVDSSLAAGVQVTHLISRVTGVCSAPQASMRALRPQTEEQDIQRVIPFYGKTDFGHFLRIRTQKKVG